MICVPPCVTCTGICKTPVPVTPRGNQSVPATGTHHSSGGGYFRLACGHYADHQLQMLYRHARPKGRGKQERFWFDTCSDWVLRYFEPMSVVSNPDTLFDDLDEEIPF